MLIVEDDPVTAVVLQGMLLKLGAAAVVRQAAGGAWEALCAQAFDLVFLDLCLDERDGEALLRRLRESPAGGAPDARVPVVVIAGQHGLDARMRLLETGADQFVMQPFDLRELEALVRAVFRRRAGADRFDDGRGLELDPVQRNCRYRGQLVALTRAEFDILLCLARSHPQAVPFAGLLKDTGESATALHVQVHHLRQKLHSSAIESVRFGGYRLADAPLAGDELPQRLAA